MQNNEFQPASSDNVEGFQRSNCKVISVEDQGHLDRLVYNAGEKGLKIYPVSKGKNWGYGSHLPVEDDSLILNLSNLNKIIQIDEEQGVATIEPGVTQDQLALELKKRKSQFYLDVTGSGAHTSIVGNALERGIAYRSLRAEALVDFEVLLVDGTRLRTGFGDFDKPSLYGLYPYGLGPNLQGLFFQSHLGIVTQACIRLNRIQEKRVAISLSVDDSKISSLIFKIKDLMEQGVLEGIPHIGNRERVSSTLIPLIENELGRSMTASEDRELNREILADWIATLFVSGKKSIVKSRLSEVKKSFSPIGKIYIRDYDGGHYLKWINQFLRKIILSPFKNKVIKASSALAQFHLGSPSNAGIQHLLAQGEVDKSETGFLLCTPLAPLSGESARRLMGILNKTSKMFPKIKTAVTLNVISDRVLEAVISLHFQKNTESSEAHELLEQLMKAYWDNGFYPYRININQMNSANVPNNVQSDLLSKIKNLVDPKSILSPGRYNF